MRDWLAANAFFAGLAVFAAALLLVGWVFFVQVLHLAPDSLRVAIGLWSLVTLILTSMIGRYVLRRVSARMSSKT